MSKPSIKIMALTFTFFACMSGRGMADWHYNVFTGCVEESGSIKKCKAMCGSTYTHTGGHTVQKDLKKCPDANPMACYCDYRD